MTAIRTNISRRTATWIGAATLAIAGFAAAPSNALSINLPPIASFSATPNPVAAGDLATFNAAASRDFDGSISRYEWDLNGDGVYETRSRTITTAGYRYGTVGMVTVRLRVTDNLGSVGSTSKSIRVHAKPVALLSADRAVPNVGDVVGYRATGSYDPDPDGYINSYYWDLDGDNVFERYTGANPYVTTSFATPGMHTIRVRVYDRFFAYTDQPLVVRVNKRPTAVISATPNPAVVDQSVALSGAASTDDRSITKYEWDLNGDGTYETNSGASPMTSTTFTTLGQVRVGLQVTDSDGAVDQSIATITVNPAPVRDTTAPLVRISPSRVTMYAGTATFEVTCPATELRCDTTLTLKGRFGSLKGKVLGRASEMIPGGETLEIIVPLTPKAKGAVRRNGQVKATAIAVATDDAGNRGTVKKFVRITKR